MKENNIGLAETGEVFASSTIYLYTRACVTLFVSTALAIERFDEHFPSDAYVAFRLTR